MAGVRSSNLGYPRIGEKREWKKALEAFWAGKIEEGEFQQTMKTLRLHSLEKQKQAGIDFIPVNDFTLYDHVLDTAAMFGLVPERFSYKEGKVPLSTYFELARGNQGAVAMEMTKWFNTNYHYLVPELSGQTPNLVENRPLHYYQEAKEELGIEGKPVILGPITFVKLSKGYDKEQLKEVVQKFVPLYKKILNELKEGGVEWVQVDEPILSTTLSREEIELFKEVYEEFQRDLPELNIWLQTYFDSVDYYKEVVSLPVQAIGLDFIHDGGRNLQHILSEGFPENKVLAAGVINGRNIWCANYAETYQLLGELLRNVGSGRLIVQPSCSLLHVPVTLKLEEEIPQLLKQNLAFADEKLTEVIHLTECLNGADHEAIFLENKNSIEKLNQSEIRNNTQVRKGLEQLLFEKPSKRDSFDVRDAAQKEAYQLPFLPTTTIGSFPQTKEVRQNRALWRKGERTTEQYEAFIQAETEKWVRLQEEIGLDVFVHGEFERNDMVEFFGEKLGGFHFTKFGWVQSYGSRCVKPPIIFGDVTYNGPMTVKETVYAQNLTEKPVKGMLTGPVTIYNWSFPRQDLSKEQVMNQIALALQKEVEALEAAGIGMIQVDEPALREGLPLKKEHWETYLQIAVNAFQLATGSVKNQTQIHTHMCYSNFEDIIESIDALDADVISIETSKSHGELMRSFEDYTYNKGIGLGVYDIHSPRVPAEEELIQNMDRALRVLDPSIFWINPDCGLKTRGETETVDALKVMVMAAKKAREKFSFNIQ
ncbi:5-methyltetrahydropteroyltriglutamate--homocysteine S-methyltransferase [Metabacillus arenae]|uniref:5-methyltetrahydropteroyltriglutamate--homocysteine methyltransferase n=1 Tax=Metabacillus arenae TaxID=2771434 RepID=A0A926N9Z0_9BACI|nr:5-methyltetrahydropteroyltriglutamate--homocysteine S-methyltransferase [Metabacillus arenae]MBD1380272.1 5-methyltetrahydropteroyltriglutamate--homocysteine S-methyltransferase [Metabacillus arenae]